LKQIFLIHGEESPAAMLMGKMREQGISAVRYPDRGELVEF